MANSLLVKDKYYRDLVNQFYANLRKVSMEDSSRQWYSSKVYYMEFKFDEALFCRMNEIEDSGIRYYKQLLPY